MTSPRPLAVILLLASLAPAAAARAQVTPSGAYVTDVPIEVPPYHGLEPHPALTYSSMGGGGVAGVGWTLGASSYIIRASPGHGTPRYDASDIFLLDGMELVPCRSGSWSPSCTHPDGGAGRFFSTKVESFRRIRFDAANDTWFVWDRDGRKSTYTGQMFAQTAGTYRWALAEVRDTHNNHVDYGYFCDAVGGGVASNRECYLDTIRYSPAQWIFLHGGGAEIRFRYELRPDPMTLGTGRDLALLRYRLKSISVSMIGLQVRAYRLTYASSSSTRRSILTSVQEFGTDATLCTGTAPCSCTTDPSGTCPPGDVTGGTSLPARTFEYPSTTSAAPGWDSRHTTAQVAVGSPPGNPIPDTTYFQLTNWPALDDDQRQILAMDIDGDGRSDQVFAVMGPTAITIAGALSKADGTVSMVPVNRLGNLYWNSLPFTGGSTFDKGYFAPGDFNGDGRDDLYLIGKSTDGNVFAAVAVSRGDGTFSISTFPTSVSFSPYDRLLVGDANGDGRDDVMQLTRVANGTNSAHTYNFGARTLLALPDGLQDDADLQDTGWALDNYGRSVAWLGDANGDGRADWMVAHCTENYIPASLVPDSYETSLRVALADLPGTTFVMNESAAWPGCHQSVVWPSMVTAVSHIFPTPIRTPWMGGDVDGDGRTDFIRVTLSGEVTAYLSDGSGVAYQQTPTVDTAFPRDFACLHMSNPSTGLTGPPPARWFTGDVDGDGRTDLMVTPIATDCPDGFGIQPYGLGIVFSRPNGWTIETRTTEEKAREPLLLGGMGDFDGNGTADLLVAEPKASGGIFVYDLHPMLSPDRGADIRRYLHADVNADGLSDLVLPVFLNPGYRFITLVQQPDGSYERFETGTGPTADLFTSGPNPLRDAMAVRWMVVERGGPNLPPDGRADLVYVSYAGSTLRIYSAFASSITGAWTGRLDTPAFSGPTPPDPNGWQAMDVNGDGRTDLVNTSYFDGRVNVGGVVIPLTPALLVYTFLANPDNTWTFGSQGRFSGLAADAANSNRWLGMDVNGDGKGDLVHVQAHTSGPIATTVRTLLATGSATSWIEAAPAHPDVYNLDAKNWFAADLNGDGRADLARVEYDAENEYIVVAGMLSRGNGLWTVMDDPSAAIPVWSLPFDVSDVARYRRLDVNGDGRTDLVHVAPFVDGGQTKTGVYILENDAAGWRTMLRTLEVDDRASLRWLPGDLDSDGRRDLGLLHPGGVRILGWDAPADRLERERNGVGGGTRVEYRTTGGLRGNLPSGMVLPIAAATVVESDIPIHQETRTTYEYDWGYWGYSDDRWIGFERFHSTVRNTRVERYFYTTEWCGQQPWMAFTRDTSAPAALNLIRSALYVPVGTGGPPYTCLTAREVQYEYEKTATFRQTSRRWEYDQFGNILRTVDNDLDGDPSDDRMSETAFYPNGQRYLVSLPGRHTISRADTRSPGSWEQVQATRYEYDDNTDCVIEGGVEHCDTPGYTKPPKLGDLRRVKRWENRSGRYLTTHYAYDGSGNVVSVTNPLGVVTTIEYDSAACPTRTYDLYPCATAVWTAAGTRVLLQKLEWNLRLGRRWRTTDANGGAWLRDYDELGRATVTSDPTGGFVRRSYLDLGTAEQRVRTEIADGSADGVLWAEQLVDGLGRTYRTKREGAVPATGAARPIRREYVYDAATPDLAQASNEFDDRAERVLTTFERDAIGRVTATVKPDQSRRTQTYGVGSRLVHDERDRETLYTIDTLGRVVDVREVVYRMVDSQLIPEYQHTTYHYDRPGPWYGDTVTQILDHGGHTTTTTRDSLGRIVESCDPDRGCVTFIHRDDGSMERRIDAMGQTIQLGYDGIGRLISKDYLDPRGASFRQSTWSYDLDPTTGKENGASRGRITQIYDSAAHARTTIGYDANGRVVDDTRCVGTDCAAFAQSYDPAGRPNSLRYADGEMVTYEYDAAGELSGIPGYMPEMRHRADGRTSLMCLADSTCTSYGYDPLHQWLASIDVMQVTPPQTMSTTHLDVSHYEHYANGLISLWTTNGLKRKLDYDALGRLTSVQHDAANAALDRTFTYDEIGNITSSTDLGSYTYDPAHPHAVETAGPLLMSYDANGNQETAFDQNTGLFTRYIAWDYDNRPSTTWKQRNWWSWSATSFAYDASGERVKETSLAGTTLTFGDLAERDPAGNLIKYYYAGGQRIARRDPTGVTFYHPDHLGSVRLMTDAAGNVINNQEYEPFGRERASSGPATNNRKYLGAPTHDGIGLVYLQARYYDPLLARFISADSIVPDQYNPQSLNRYSYSLNSPISFADPSGRSEYCVELCPPPIAKPQGSDPSEWEPYQPPPPLVEAIPLGSDPGEWNSYQPSPPLVQASPTQTPPTFWMPPRPLPYKDRHDHGFEVFMFGSFTGELAERMVATRFPKLGAGIPLSVKKYLAVEAEVIGVLGYSFTQGPYVAGILAVGLKLGGKNTYAALFGGMEITDDGHTEPIIIIEASKELKGGLALNFGAFEIGPDDEGHLQPGLFVGIAGGPKGKMFADHGSLGIGIAFPSYDKIQKWIDRTFP